MKSKKSMETDKLETCDFCGRSEKEFLRRAQGTSNKFEIDEDGLWECGECLAGIISKPLGSADEDVNDERIRKLIGKSARAICRTMNIPYSPPYKTIIDAVFKIAYDEDRFMSTWSFAAQWIDGTTVWLSADKNTKALVFPNEDVEFQTTNFQKVG
ncbi:hypothetical protein ACFLY4_02315 [Chloroflexota bacterium]